MPDGSVDAVVTSPPFWSLRDYGTGAWHGGDPTCPHPVRAERRIDGASCGRCGATWVDPQYGLEPTVEEYIDRLVPVFDEAMRVLNPAGTLWLNLGDSYTGGTRRAYDTSGGITGTRGLPTTGVGSPLPAKNLIGVPWRTAFALQARGWRLRNAVIWSKTNPMPESVTDRLSTGYELLFLFTKSHSYYFNLDPIRIRLVRPEAADGTRIIGGARKGRTGGIGATERRRGTAAYGAGKYGADEVGVEPRAGRGNLVPLGHAHTAVHSKGRNPGDDLLTAPTTPRDHLAEGAWIIWGCTAWRTFGPISGTAERACHASAGYGLATGRRCRTW
ncbi:site-specific DNA-methyltransferase [Plantactinospora sp. S1510]|uniref:Methyltransferase n=1 Tax=Plantactinospora alkalitolerans TaxID=2789879 RepID=A0ABS0H352_9ACTN|nr:site-specific DNA-methyltransferase [Plantactinospora alkalitolerans]MBF9132749.1 site-specific DNA-methyltransferase [Plantactinospora alkalitolerans]